ncbi:putative bifunctional diguanylate cyclase/phosphodiesterase [Caballeronia sp. RCC_10]|uniref:putative bifunctional diguanylate cyclase/phosphodiesterase n=1 Tax=Caballeronia sp. RCC_10 TaxID=3239227 RepID=UPI003523DCD7
MANRIKRFLDRIGSHGHSQRLRAGAFLLVVTLGAALACYWASVSHAQEEAALNEAMAVSAQLELLATIHIDANAEFLRGVGTARFGSNAWPVARTAAVMRSYDFLERSLTDDSASLYQLADLRASTAALAFELESAANEVARAGHARLVDPSRLEAANRTLQQIMHSLSNLQLTQNSKLAAMQLRAETQLARQRMSFALALALGLTCLGYALLFAHRASLARNAASITARQAHDRFIEYFEQHPLAMLIFDVETRLILTANAAAQRQYGGDLDTLRRITVDELRPPEGVEQFKLDLCEYIRSGSKAGSGGVRRHSTLDGRTLQVDVSYHFLDYAGRSACFVTAADVTEHETARAELRIRSRALEASQNAVLITESTVFETGPRVAYANPAFQHLTGLRGEEVLGKPANDVLFAAFGDDRASTPSDADGSTVVTGKRADGTVFWAQRHVSPVVDERGVATHTVAVFSDISDRIRDQQRLSWLATTDPLTQLPNRAALHFRLGELIATASRRGCRVAAVFLDLDNFKEINDSLGHTAGDKVLKEVARRLSEALCEPDLVARIAGDEFVALLSGSDLDRLINKARGLHRLVSADMLAGDDLVESRASAGVAVFPDHATDADELVRYADAAMYQAKRERNSDMRVFDQSIAVASVERLYLTQGLHHALKTDQFRLLFQPRIGVKGLRTVAFEALLRWRDPARGDINPATFIPLAEEKGLIVPIGEWVLRNACRQAREWADEYPDIVVSINVSPVQFLRSDFADTLERTLRSVGVNPRNVELEITESVLMTPVALTCLHLIRRLGVSIAIDDFGTGFSSLTYIRDFKADCIKLDISFVQGIGISTIDEVIVRAVLAMAHTLGTRVVAEGVETPAQLAFLAEHRCDEVQGYLLGRPMPAADATRALARAETSDTKLPDDALQPGTI